MASLEERFRDIRHQAAYAGHDVRDWSIRLNPIAATCPRCGVSLDRWVHGSRKAIPACEPTVGGREIHPPNR